MEQVEKRLNVMRTRQPVMLDQANPVRLVSEEWGMTYKAKPVVEGDYDGLHHVEVHYGTMDQFQSLMEVVGAQKPVGVEKPISTWRESGHEYDFSGQM